MQAAEACKENTTISEISPEADVDGDLTYVIVSCFFSFSDSLEICLYVSAYPAVSFRQHQERSIQCLCGVWGSHRGINCPWISTLKFSPKGYLLRA